MAFIAEQPASKEALRLALQKGAAFQASPQPGWTFRVNWKAFITDADLEQARNIERSGSLDGWLDPKEDVFEK